MRSGKRSLTVVLAVAFLATIIWLGFFAPLSTPRITLNEHRALESIRDLTVAENKYARLHQNGGYACALLDLRKEGLVNAVLASGTMAGYHFEIGCVGDHAQRVTSYTITAIPVSPGITGKYVLCSNQSGEIWYNESGSPSDCLATHKPVRRNDQIP